jgi:hypothetical protein
VTASPKASADSTSPGSAAGPAEASSLGSATRPAAYGITDCPAAGSRGVQAFPAPVALLLDFAAPADTLEDLARAAPLHRGGSHCAVLGLATRGWLGYGSIRPARGSACPAGD